jgi:hypothetical protein
MVILSVAVLYTGFLIASASLAEAYVVWSCSGDYVKYPTPQINWDGDFEYNQSYLGIFPTQTRQDIANSAMQWDDIVTGSSLNVDEVSSNHNAWWTAIPFEDRGLPDGWAGATVHGFDGCDVDWAVSYLNSDWSWNRNCDLDGIDQDADTRVVTVHEIGHWLVLDDDPPSHPEAVMTFNFTCKIETEDDDQDGANFLYP